MWKRDDAIGKMCVIMGEREKPMDEKKARHDAGYQRPSNKERLKELTDKIPSGGFFSFIKTDIVEDKYFEKRADFGLESDNMSLGANR